MEEKFILAPGPTQGDQKFVDLMSTPVIYHRCEDFHRIYTETCEYLRQIVGLDGGFAFPITCSGTGAMESSVANFFSPNDEVLVISVGNFGNRFYQICEAYNLNVTKLGYEACKSYDYNEVKDFVDSHPNLAGIIMTYHETSTGVLNKLKPIGDLIADRDDCVLVVDAISGMMVHPVKMTEWGVDCVLGCSQKGFLIPPGLATVALSDKAINLLDRSTSTRFYFDYRKVLKRYEEQETPFTPNTTLIYVMHEVLDYLVNEYGMDNYYAHHKELCDYLREQINARGYDTSIVSPEDRGNFLVVFELGGGMSAPAVKKELDRRGWIVATGFGDFKPTHLRVGVVGGITREDIDAFLAELDRVVDEIQA
ncbi:MAG: aminotransferase class V-fold PLP-dependent enzyme [Coriobacteriia bacterium]|nr:aminotransferase class V-fold PLP-dependent enzyme [Coriobacteriia bacterium]